MTYKPQNAPTRRDLLQRIGLATSSAVLYQTMASLGHAAESEYSGPIKLEGAPKGASVVILGAGHAGMIAAIELRKAGYKVKILEYLPRAGGRCWTLRGGDVYTELGGATQRCGFDRGNYINPGPWRIPYHHRAILDYCKRYSVKLEPFVELNANSYLHNSKAFEGKPQRFRHIAADYAGYTSELLAKAANQDKLDEPITAEDKEILLESLRDWGSLDESFQYTAASASYQRGYDKDPGGGPNGAPVDSQPIAREDILRSRLWRSLSFPLSYDFAQTLFQPVGGMDMIAEAFARELRGVIEFNVKVVEINQSDKGVAINSIDARSGAKRPPFQADWCVCTIPLSVLSQVKANFSDTMKTAISAVPYASAIKVGMQFKRRFWEEDEAMYGGITFTDLPNGQISYPSADFLSSGKGVLLAAYMFGVHAFEFSAKTPEERARLTLDYVSQIHPQARAEYDNAMSVAWHRMPATLGCFGLWSSETRANHYRDLCAIDGRVVLAGEHCSYVNAWQEGAILSSLDAITRLHQRVVASANGGGG